MIRAANIPFPRDIPALTSLRFCAAFIALIFHIRFFSDLVFPPILDSIMWKGLLGVDFFFILSGFILTHCYYGAIKRHHFSYKIFMIRRLARIYPVHLFTLLISLAMFYVAALALIPVHENSFFVNYFIYNLFLIQAWGLQETLSYNNVSWSLSAEFFAYLCFPLFIHMLMRYKPEKALAVSFFIFSICWIVVAYSTPLKLTTLNTFGILRIVPDFMIGISLYFFAQKYSIDFYKDGAMALVIFLILLSFAIGLEDYVVIVLFAILIYMAAEQSRSNYNGLFSSPWFIYLGKISYSLYMVQFCAWFILMKFVLINHPGLTGLWLDPRIVWFLSIIPVMMAAILTYHFIECPAHRWINNKFAKKREL